MKEAPVPGIPDGAFLTFGAAAAAAPDGALLHHPAHATHAAARHRGRAAALRLRLLGHHRFGGEHQAGDRRGIEQGRPDHLGWIDDARLQQVLVLFLERVEAEGALAILHLDEDDRAFVAGVAGDPAERLLDRPLHDLDAEALLVADLELLEDGRCPDERDAATRHDAFFDRGTGRVERILDTRLLLLHLDLGRRADPDDRDAADQLCEPLLELLAVVVRGGVLDLRPDLLDAALDVGLLAGPVDERRVVLVDHDPLAAPEVLQGDVLELHAELLGDELAAGEDGDVLEYGFAPIAEARGLHRDGLQRAADLVHDQRRQRLTLQILRDDEERFRGPRSLLEQREQVLHRGDLLLVDEDVHVLVHALHPLGVGDKVRGQVAAVELHALDHLELSLEALGFLDRDHAFLADLAHRLADDLADGGVVVGGYGADLRDLLLLLGGLGERLQLGGERGHGLVDAALQGHRVVTRGDHLEALGEDRAREHGRRRGAVTGDVRRLGGDLLHHLGAHVLEPVLELDLLGDRHAVLGDGGSAPRLLENDVAPAGAEGDRDRVGEHVDAAQDFLPRVLTERYELGWHRFSLDLDHAEDVLLAHDEVFLAVELDLRARVLPEQDGLADLHADGHQLAVVVHLALADGDDLALLGLLLGGVRDDDPTLGLLGGFCESFHDDAILKWPDLHSPLPLS